jgi:hypothetical protein
MKYTTHIHMVNKLASNCGLIQKCTVLGSHIRGRHDATSNYIVFLLCVYHVLEWNGMKRRQEHPYHMLLTLASDNRMRKSDRQGISNSGDWRLFKPDTRLHVADFGGNAAVHSTCDLRVTDGPQTSGRQSSSVS